MQFSTLLTAAFAATALAAPAVRVVDEVKQVVVTVTAGTPQATAAALAQQAGKHVVAAAPAAGSFIEQAPQKPAAAAAPASDSNVDSGTTSDNTGILNIYNQWRAKYNLSPLEWNDRLCDNAVRTGQLDGGKKEIHHLDSGIAEGQIITPGKRPDASFEGMGGFDLAMAAWLCEVSSDEELRSTKVNGKGVCDIVDSYGMRYNDRGHHDIIVDPKYKYLGCAFAPNGSTKQYQGLWVCTVSPGL